jgi:hypothetical protein
MTKVTVQNRHIQRAITAWESGIVRLSEICPLHQAIDERGLIQGPYAVASSIIEIRGSAKTIVFNPPLGEDLYLPAAWPAALAKGQEYVFELQL